VSEPQSSPDLLKLIKLNPLRISYICGSIALLMGLTDYLFMPIFRVEVGDWFVLPLWIPFAIYSGLQYFIWAQIQDGLTLEDAELEQWGGALAEQTPGIKDALEEGQPVAKIAAELEERAGIPAHVTLRYVVALGRHLNPDG